MYQRQSTRVFQIHELAVLITRCTFRRVNTEEHLVGRGTLVALTRVNRMLSEIALCELWMVLNSGGPLVWLLPWNFDRLVEPAKANKRMITELELRVATPRDLERYMKYSSYVHELNASRDTDEICRLLEMADRFVFQLNCNDCHFAKLLSLMITISPSRLVESENYLKMRGNQFIRHLGVFLPNMEQEGPWFEEIGQYYSGISSLEIRSLDTTTAKDPWESKFNVVVDGLVCLQVLKLDIEPDTIPALLPKVRGLPLLKYLALRISEDSPERDPSFEELALKHPRKPVKVLQLEYEGRPRNSLCALLSISNSLSIHYTRIYCISVPVAFPREIQAMVGWITVNSPGIQMLNLSDQMGPLQWVVDLHPDDIRTMLAIPPCVLSHLARLHRLRSLMLATFGGTVLSPELLETLATSLTSLEHCVFSAYRLVDEEGTPKCSVRLTDVMNFVFQCPSLRYLRVCCDARRSANPPTSSAVSANSSQLSTLDVGQSMIDDSEYVAGILQKSLPALRQVIYGGADVHMSLVMTSVEEGMWDNVGRIINRGRA